MYNFLNKSDNLEFNVNIESDKNLQSYLDATVTINFSINGFSGMANGYILKDEMEIFCKEIIEFEKSRVGFIHLKDVGGDIDFTIKSIDSLGHIAIICKVTNYGYLGNKSELYMASGFFEIDPKYLVEFSKELWLSQYTEK